MAHANNTDQFTTLKALVRQAKHKKVKHFEKKKRFTKHKVIVMVQKNVNKFFKAIENEAH